MHPWPGAISAITLFAEDLAATKQFYIDVFGLPVHYEDDVSAVFKFGDTLINLLAVTRGARVDRPGRRGVTRCRRALPVHAHGRRRRCDVRRPAAPRRRAPQRPDGPAVGHPDGGFRDPAGHIWEIAK